MVVKGAKNRQRVALAVDGFYFNGVLNVALSKNLLAASTFLGKRILPTFNLITYSVCAFTKLLTVSLCTPNILPIAE